MKTPDSRSILKVTALKKGEMESKLEKSLAVLREQALLFGDRGILITRHSASEFTLELHAHVPFGMTHERDDWRPRSDAITGLDPEPGASLLRGALDPPAIVLGTVGESTAAYCPGVQ